MTRTRKFKWFGWATIALAVALAGLLVGCAAPGAVPGTASDTGTLRVLIDNQVRAKSLLPPISMECSSYDVTVRDKTDKVVATAKITGDRAFTNLVPADSPFSVAIVGLNSEPRAIGDGSATGIMLSANTIVDCPIMVVELPGDGILHVHVDWTAYPTAVTIPVVQSELSYGGIASAEDISDEWDLATPHVAGLNKTPLARGWYLLVWRLFEEGSTAASAGFATLARIVQSQITDDTILVVPSPSTGFRLLIDFDFFDALPMSTETPEGILSYYSADDPDSISVSAAEAAAFQWYLNGTAVGGNSNTYTVQPATLLPDISYTLNVIAFSVADGGKHGGMLTWTLAHKPWDTHTVFARFDGTVGKDYEVALLNKTGGTVVKSVVVAGAAKNEVAIPAVAEGINYALRVREYPWSDGKPVEYFLNAANYAAAQTITVPIATPTFYDLGALAYSAEADPFTITLTFTGNVGISYDIMWYNAAGNMVGSTAVIATTGTTTFVRAALPAGALRFKIGNSALNKAEFWQQVGTLAAATPITFPVSVQTTLPFGTLDFTY